MMPRTSYSEPLKRDLRRLHLIRAVDDITLIVATCLVAGLIGYIFLNSLLVITAPAPLPIGCC